MPQRVTELDSISLSPIIIQQRSSRAAVRPASESVWRSVSVLALGLVVTEIAFAAPALAQTAPTSAESSPSASQPVAEATSQVQEILVTAEKRSTSLQRTPVAVTAITSETIAEHQVRDLRDIQAIVPNFKMGDAEGISQITVRGVGSSVFKPGSEGEVAVNENEVYIARGVAQQTGLFDVSGLEVLRGPQGTLYGRNATAGAVNITTTRPSDTFSGYGEATIGNYNDIRFEGGLGGPLDKNGKLLLRVAGFEEHHNGYGKNLVTGNGVEDKDAYGVRATLVYLPTDALQGTLIAEYFHQQDHSGQFHYFGPGGTTGLPGASGLQPVFITEGGFAPTNPRDVAYPVDGSFGLRTFALTGIIDWKSDGPFSVRSVTGYRDQRAPYTFNIDGGSTQNAQGFSDEPAHQISEELQLHYDTNGLHITAGGYFFHENDNVVPQYFVFSSYLINRDFGLTPASPFIRFLSQQAVLKTNAYAGYGQGSYNITSKLSLTAGVRYSTETKSDTSQFGVQLTTPYPSNAPFPNPVMLKDVTFSSVTPKFGVQYQLEPRTMIYATYAKGFKSGGFDVGVANPLPYQPEQLTDYEGGIKTTLVDGRLRANVAGFYYNYTNLQVQQVLGTAVQTSNAANAKVYGLEGEFTFLVTPDFELNASASWTHARYGQFCGSDGAQPNIVTPSSCPTVNGGLLPHEADLSGNSLSNAPDWRGNLAGQYTFNLLTGSLIFRGELEYSSRFYFAPDNLSFLSQAPYAKVDLYVTYRPNKTWQVRAYLKNIGDVTTKTSALVASALVGSPIIGSVAPPRTFGIQLAYKF